MSEPSINLPREINYSMHQALPANTINTSMFLRPVNGNKFTENGVIQFDLPSYGYLDPSTLCLKYTMKYTQSTAGGLVRGTPAASPFSSSQVFIGANSVECINQYGVVYNMITNLKMDVAMKASAPHLGYADLDQDPSWTNQNGCELDVSAGVQSKFMALPLMNILSGCERLVPLFCMPNVRLQLTLDTMSNYIASTLANTTGVEFVDFELCYDQISFGSEVDNIIRSQGPFTIKSSSWASMAQTLAASTAGSATMAYNMRYSSIRSLFMINGGQSTASLGKTYDSYDLTSKSGTYGFTVNGVQYPSQVINVATNRMGALLELKNAINGIHSVNSNCMSISTREWWYSGNDTTTVQIPAKFYFGVNTEKLQTNSAMLSGISTRDSAINYNITIGNSAGTPQAYQCILVALYDTLLKINPDMRDCQVVQ